MQLEPQISFFVIDGLRFQMLIQNMLYWQPNDNSQIFNYIQVQKLDKQPKSERQMKEDYYFSFPMYQLSIQSPLIRISPILDLSRLSVASIKKNIDSNISWLSKQRSQQIVSSQVLKFKTAFSSQPNNESEATFNSQMPLQPTEIKQKMKENPHEEPSQIMVLLHKYGKIALFTHAAVNIGILFGTLFWVRRSKILQRIINSLLRDKRKNIEQTINENIAENVATQLNIKKIEQVAQNVKKTSSTVEPISPQLNSMIMYGLTFLIYNATLPFNIIITQSILPYIATEKAVKSRNQQKLQNQFGLQKKQSKSQANKLLEQSPKLNPNPESPQLNHDGKIPTTPISAGQNSEAVFDDGGDVAQMDDMDIDIIHKYEKFEKVMQKMENVVQIFMDQFEDQDQ